MPTRYTADISEGIGFPEFVMSCARAFGALISMRDSPHDAPIPTVFEPADYYTEDIESTERELLELRNMTLEEAEKTYELEYQKTPQAHTNYDNKKIELKHKYESMLEKVREWRPPSADHEGLKEGDLEYHQKKWAEEQERCAERTEWVNLLRESLGLEV